MSQWHRLLRYWQELDWHSGVRSYLSSIVYMQFYWMERYQTLFIGNLRDPLPMNHRFVLKKQNVVGLYSDIIMKCEDYAKQPIK